MVTVSYHDFEVLRKQVGSDWQNYTSDENSLKKSILLHTPYAGLNFLLTRRELDNLHHMLEQTDNERKAAQLLQFIG